MSRDTKGGWCVCGVKDLGEGVYQIKYCPKHKAATALYEACIHALAIIASLPDETATFKELSEALAKVGK